MTYKIPQIKKNLPSTVFKKGNIPWSKGKAGIYSEESRKKMSESQKRRFENEDSPRKGKHHTEEAKKKISESKKGSISWNRGMKGYQAGKNHYNWKGDDVGYSPLHRWVKKQIEVWECGVCGQKELRGKDGRTLIELANISGEYKRDLSDWLILCKPCHVEYDGERGIQI